jgi:hypothetical protein
LADYARDRLKVFAAAEINQFYAIGFDQLRDSL